MNEPETVRYIQNTFENYFDNNAFLFFMAVFVLLIIAIIEIYQIKLIEYLEFPVSS